MNRQKGSQLPDYGTIKLFNEMCNWTKGEVNESLMREWEGIISLGKIKMKKSLKTILSLTALVVLICCLVLSTAYIWLTRPSERELWRMMQYNRIDHLTIVDNILLFEGYKKDDSTECICVYAVNKLTGKAIWSTEELAKPYIEKEKKLQTDPGQIPGINYIVSFSEPNAVVYVMVNFETLFALNSSDGKVIWQRDFSGIYPLTFFDSFSNESVFLIDAQSNLVALDIKTGKELWNKPTTWGKDQYAWLKYNNNVVYATLGFDSYKQHLVFDAKTGRKIWETKTRAISSAFAFSDNMLFSSNLDSWDNRNHIYLTAFDIHTGQKTWEASFQELTLGALATNTIDDQVYVIVDKNRDTFYRVARLVVMSEQTGEILWQFNSDFSHGSISYFIKNDLVYIGTEDGYVFALDRRKTGQEIWKTKMPAFPTYFILNGDSLLAGFRNNYLAALDLKSGKKRWELNLNVDTIYEEGWFEAREVMMIQGNILFVSSKKPAVYAVDVSNGKLLWSWQQNILPWHSIYTLGLIESDIIYVFNDEGLFALKTGK